MRAVWRSTLTSRAISSSLSICLPRYQRFRRLAEALDALAKQRLAAVYAPLDGRDRDAGEGRDPLERHVVEEAQAEHERVLRRHLFERARELVVGLRPGERPRERREPVEQDFVELDARGP